MGGRNAGTQLCKNMLEASLKRSATDSGASRTSGGELDVVISTVCTCVHLSARHTASSPERLQWRLVRGHEQLVLLDCGPQPRHVGRAEDGDGDVKQGEPLPPTFLAGLLILRGRQRPVVQRRAEAKV